MKWFSNLKIAHKLALGFGLCLALSLAMGLTSISRMALMNNNTSLLNNDTVAGVSNIAELYNDVKQYRIFQFRYLLTTDRAGIDDLEGKMTDKATEVNKDIADYDKSASQDEDKKNVQELKKQWDSYLELTPALLGSVHTNDFKGASKEMLGEGLNRFNLVTDQLDRMNIWNSKHGEKLANEAESAYLNARSVTLVMLLLAIAFGIVSAMAVTRSITVPLAAVANKLDLLRTSCATNLRAAMDALAQGDMTVAVIPTSTPLTIDAKDECGDLARAFNGLLDQVKGAVLAYQSARDALSTLLAQATNTANNIAQAADEIATGNTDLSQRTEEQASSLEETASSMEQMTATVKQNADNARQANQLAAQARDVAQSGGEVVANAVCAMAQINEGSTRIADIVGVIDEIAFQTNLLALNAAVEAARVGEQGRGFAVVAAEVRSLAGRSATAAKEIKALVTESVSQVQAGSTLVNQSGERLGEIVSSVKKVAQIIAEISAASVEQASGIDQVNRAVMQMDQITQQNAALVEEAAAASSSMASQAQGLQGLVSRFQVEGKYLQTVQQSVQATGTYGGGGGSHRSRSASRRSAPASSSASPSLTLVKAGNGGNGDAHADFEEF